MAQQYDVIYADPPWKYAVQNKHGCANNHYKTMSDEELFAMGDWIKSISNPKASCCILWCTWPRIETGLELLREWGFKYKTVWQVWLKVKKEKHVRTRKSMKEGQPKEYLIPSKSLGSYTRSNTEFCLIGTRGKTKDMIDKPKALSQIVVSARREHSRKPDTVRDVIDSFFKPSAQKIELFARCSTPRDKWEFHGDQNDYFN